MLGKIGGFIIGIVAGLVAMVGIAYVGGNFFPAPAAAPGDLAEQAASALAAAPFGFKLVIVLCWFLGSLIGAWLAKLVSGSGGVAWAVTIVLTLLILANIFVAAFPTWMAIGRRGGGGRWSAARSATAWLALARPRCRKKPRRPPKSNQELADCAEAWRGKSGPKREFDQKMADFRRFSAFGTLPAKLLAWSTDGPAAQFQGDLQ